MMPREPVGVLILRVWLEQGSPTPFRADIRVTADVGFAPSASRYLAEPGEVIEWSWDGREARCQAERSRARPDHDDQA